MKIENKEIEIKNKIVEMYSNQFYQVDYVEVDIFKNGYGDYSCHVQLVSKEIGLAEKVDDCFIGDESFENIVHLIPYAPYTDIIAKDNEFSIVQMETDEDHIHLLIECSPQHYIPDIVKALKGVSARILFKDFKDLKKRLWA